MGRATFFMRFAHANRGKRASMRIAFAKKGYASHACGVVSVTQQQSRKCISGSRIRTYAQLERECNAHFPQRFVIPHAKDASDTREITVQRANDSARFASLCCASLATRASGSTVQLPHRR